MTTLEIAAPEFMRRFEAGEIPADARVTVTYEDAKMKTLAQPRPALTAKFEALASLKNGWFEGQGLAPDKTQLALVAEKWSDGYTENLVLPLIAPTPEGNLLFEWDVPGSPSVDLELSSLKAEFHALALDGSDIERDFQFKSDDDWRAFFDFLRVNVGAQ